MALCLALVTQPFLAAGAQQHSSLGELQQGPLLFLLFLFPSQQDLDVIPELFTPVLSCSQLHGVTPEGPGAGGCLGGLRTLLLSWVFCFFLGQNYP